MVTIPSEPEWLAAMAQARQEIEGVKAMEKPSQPPVHPVPVLQGPFEESIIESDNRPQDEGLMEMDAQSRRDQLLQNKEYIRMCGGTWRQMSHERYHPLWKLIAQISFGMHLLVKGLAKSEVDVMKILQRHVDELDTFLERTTEDFLLAQNDIEDRLKYLRLPLENLSVFDQMLEDPGFRQSVINDNEMLNYIMERSTTAMNDAFKDTRKGIDAVKTLGGYLEGLGNEWQHRSYNLDAVYQVMIGNVEGWHAAFSKLQNTGDSLAISLAGLKKAISEIRRRVSIASNRNLVSLNTDSRVRTRSFKSVFRKSSSKQSSFSVPHEASDKAFVGRPNDLTAKKTITHRIDSGESSKRSTPESEILGFREGGKNKPEVGTKSKMELHATYLSGNNGGKIDSPASIRKEKQALPFRSKSSSGLNKPVAKSEALPTASKPRAETPPKWLHGRSGIQSTRTLEKNASDSPQMSHLILTLDVPAQEDLLEGDQGEKDAESQLTALPPLASSTADINDRTTNIQHRRGNSSSSFLGKSSPLSTLRSHKTPPEGSGLQLPESAINPVQASTLPSLQREQTESIRSRERLGLGIRIDKSPEIQQQFYTPTSIPPTSPKASVTTLERGVEPSEGRLRVAMKHGYGVGTWLVYRKQSR
ncbi:hypothetical protein V8E54_009442 [Elaphomyces granulatus]